jgi:hypothetical protein
MKWLLKTWSYLANPVFIPSLISLWYFNYADIMGGEHARLKMYLIFILTAAIPLLFYLVLKILKVVDSIHLNTPKERILPLTIYGVLLLIVLRGSFNDGFNMALYYFFMGVLVATIIAIVLSIARYKMSLHMMAMGGALGFVICISLLMGLPLIQLIIGLSIASGLTASSRLFMKAHVGHELIFGFAVGLISQLVMLSQYALILQ